MTNEAKQMAFESEVFDLGKSGFAAAMETVVDSSTVFDEDSFLINERPVPGYETAYKYVPWGAFNCLPYHIIKEIGNDEIMSQNMYFNVLTCYGDGLRYTDLSTGQPATGEIGRFMMSNSLNKFFINQATDIKYFFFAVAVIVLSQDGTKIVQVRHKEASYCRFEKADKNGRINHVFYANWARTAPALQRKDVEVLQLLDENNPLGHLEVLLGKAPGADGLTKVRTTNRKFAIVMKFPTPGLQYYPVPYYTALFRGDWYDLKRYIGKGKKAKIKNHAGIRYHIMVNQR